MNNLKAKMFNKRAKQGAKEVIPSLNIKKGMTVADLGSGGGYYTYKFAEMVGEDGKVYAIDTDEKFLAYVKRNSKEKGLLNVQTFLAVENDANLPDKSCDLIFMRNVFHHISEPARYFANLKKSLKPSGCIALLDWKPGATFFAHSTSREEMTGAMEAAGYMIQKEFDLLANQNFIIFKIKQEDLN